jgi:hypothetical protein
MKDPYRIMKDPYTLEEFTQKRTNQRFASALSRQKFHNTRANELRNEMAFIQRPLYKNYKILKDLLENKSEIIVHREFLLGKSYDLSKATHISKLGSEMHYCVYNFILMPLANDLIKILRNVE